MKAKMSIYIYIYLTKGALTSASQLYLPTTQYKLYKSINKHYIDRGIYYEKTFQSKCYATPVKNIGLCLMQYLKADTYDNHTTIKL